MEGKVKIVRQLEPGHKGTEMLSFDPNNKEALYKRLASYTDLLELEMEGCNLKDEDAQAIAEFLPKNKGFTRLFLLENFIGPQGVEALAEAAKELPELHDVNLARNMLLDRAGGEAAANLLRNAPKLLSLNVSLNQMKDEGSAVLADAVERAPQLRKLTASQLNNSVDGFNALVKSVRDHPSLQNALLMRDTSYTAQKPEEEQAIKQLAGGEAKNLTAFSPRTPLVEAVISRNKVAAERAARMLEREPDTLDYTERAALYERWNVVCDVANKLRPPLDTSDASLKVMQQRFAEHMHALPKTAKDADGLFQPNAEGFAPLDNPAIWRNPQQVLEAVESLTRELLERTTPKGVSLLASATAAARISTLLPALNAKGVQLKGEALLEADNTPTPLFQTIIDRGDGSKLFTRDNWRGAHPAEMRRAADALPAEQRALVPMRTLTAALGLDQPRVARGR